jgi:hypothetical protein
MNTFGDLGMTGPCGASQDIDDLFSLCTMTHVGGTSHLAQITSLGLNSKFTLLANFPMFGQGQYDVTCTITASTDVPPKPLWIDTSLYFAGSIVLKTWDKCLRTVKYTGPANPVRLAYQQNQNSGTTGYFEDILNLNDFFSITINDPFPNQCFASYCNVVNSSDVVSNDITTTFSGASVDHPNFEIIVKTDTVIPPIDLFLRCEINDNTQVLKLPIEFEVFFDCTSAITLPTILDSYNRASDSKYLEGLIISTPASTSDPLNCPIDQTTILWSDSTNYNNNLVKVEADGSLSLTGNYGLDVQIMTRVSLFSGSVVFTSNNFDVEVQDCTTVIQIPTNL